MNDHDKWIRLFALGNVPDRNEIAHCARSEGDLPCRLSFRPRGPRFDGGMPALTLRAACRIAKTHSLGLRALLR
jgi:hypothetical protein